MLKLKKFINFIKYNNIAALILIALLVLGTSALAAEPVRQVLGQKITTTKGFDNTLLLAADLDKMNMNFKIEKIEQDSNFYYVTYTYLDLVKTKQAWEYKIKEKVMKINKKIKKDLGVYLAQELSEVRYDRLKYLKKAQAKARQKGVQQRVAVTTYSGLLGKVLNTASRVFTDYQPTKVQPLPAPPDLSVLRTIRSPTNGNFTSASSSPDNLTKIYRDYIARKDPDKDNVFGLLDNCPQTYNPSQLDSDNDGIGDACDSENNSQNGQQTASTTNSIASSTNSEIASSSLNVEVISTSSQPTLATTTESAPAHQGPANQGTSPNQATSAAETIVPLPPNDNSQDNEVEIIDLGTLETATSS